MLRPRCGARAGRGGAPAGPSRTHAKGAQAGPRRIVLAALVLSNAINVGFLVFDERMWNPEPITGSALLAGALAYVVAVPLVLRSRTGGFWLSPVVGVLASVVVVGDNFAVFGSTPNAATYALNWAFFAAQVPLVAGSLSWLTAARRAVQPT